ncbi:MAG: hypothetical protein SPI72_02460 [Porphyromonas sp.]|nr:hypothetical protein [Porphyromonas sp.]
MRRKPQRIRLKREHAVRLLFNDREWTAIEQYCEDFAVRNRGRWLRETVMREVIGRLELNAPLLFPEEEMQ